MINALLLSYAVIRHELVDIKMVLRRGLTWTTLGVIGVLSYWLVYQLLHLIMGYEIDTIATFAATISVLAVAVVVY
ncbi:hypothetical protein ACFLXC_03395 [Chloroflexota bacterium]